MENHPGKRKFILFLYNLSFKTWQICYSKKLNTFKLICQKKKKKKAFLCFNYSLIYSILPFQVLMKTPKKNKTVRNRLYNKKEKAGKFLRVEFEYSKYMFFLPSSFPKKLNNVLTLLTVHNF